MFFYLDKVFIIYYILLFYTSPENFFFFRWKKKFSGSSVQLMPGARNDEHNGALY